MSPPTTARRRPRPRLVLHMSPANVDACARYPHMPPRCAGSANPASAVRLRPPPTQLPAIAHRPTNRDPPSPTRPFAGLCPHLCHCHPGIIGITSTISYNIINNNNRSASTLPDTNPGSHYVGAANPSPAVLRYGSRRRPGSSAARARRRAPGPPSHQPPPLYLASPSTAPRQPASKPSSPALCAPCSVHLAVLSRPGPAGGLC